MTSSSAHKLRDLKMVSDIVSRIEEDLNQLKEWIKSQFNDDCEEDDQPHDQEVRGCDMTKELAPPDLRSSRKNPVIAPNSKSQTVQDQRSSQEEEEDDGQPMQIKVEPEIEFILGDNFYLSEEEEGQEGVTTPSDDPMNSTASMNDSTSTPRVPNLLKRRKKATCTLKSSPKSPRLKASTPSTSLPSTSLRSNYSINRKMSPPKTQGIFICPATNCGKKFSEKSLIIRHLKTHPDGFKFECKICSKHFKSKVSLQTHNYTQHSILKVAEELRPVSFLDRFKKETFQENCPFCGRLYRVRSSLNSHLQDIHFACNCVGCSRQFSNRVELMAHKESDHSRRPNK